MAFLDDLEELHESQWLEMKEAGAGLPNDLWESYSAMANTEGGEIVLGIHEDVSTGIFTVVGVVDADSLINQFWNTVHDRQKVEHDVMLVDGVRPTVVNGKDVVIIDVPRAERDAKPVRVYDKKEKSFVAWVRRGKGDYKASEEELRRMGYDSVPYADRKPLERFDLSALSDETIAHYRQVFAANKPESPWNSDSKEDFLYHIGAVVKGRGGLLHPTQAGLLAFGFEYEITNYLPQYLLDYREATSEVRRWSDRIVSQSGDWSGNVIDFYYMVTERLIRRFESPFTTDATGTRHGVGNPIMEAVNEVVANALIHAYYQASAPIRIVLEPGALVASNPGCMLLDKEVAIAGGYSETRNPTLMRIFSFIGVSDRAGSGVEMVFKTWRGLAGTAPRLEEHHAPASVEVSLPLVHLSMALTQRAPLKREPLTKERVLSLIEGSPNGLTAKEVEGMTGYSSRSAQRRFDELMVEGAIVRNKDGQAFRYHLPLSGSTSAL